MKISSCVLLAAALFATPLSSAYADEAADLEVDLREAPRKLFHARLTLPVGSGPLVLVYPKWLPGEHGPTGPIADLASLAAHAGDKRLAWRRDPLDMYRLQIDVPEGARQVVITYDYLGSALQDGFSTGASTTAQLAILNWNMVLLYPAGADPRRSTYRPSVRLPAGWKHATALTNAGRDGDRVVFAPVTLETLIDSPVLAAVHLAEYPLGENHGAKVFADVAAESEPELRPTAQMLESWKRLVAEEAALFGARHFDAYHFLLTVSDGVTHFGLEHHQSSDDRVGGRTLVDKELSVSVTDLLAHESVHSWNGKYRRPAGLATGDYQQPMNGELLWVYEGLTQYLGTVLTARSGGWDAKTLRDHYAATAESQRNIRGRATRPMSDTAVAAQVLYGSRDAWGALRRSVDFYEEGDLIWLEVDLLIREKTSGQKSLDDFIRAFHGGKSGSPMVVPYQLGDVIGGLNAVAPNDWQGFFASRIQTPTEDAPLQGLLAAGWKLDYGDEPSDYQKSQDKISKRLDLRSSIGLAIDAEKNLILDVIPAKAADKAGLAPTMKVVAVNGRRYTPELLVMAVEETRRGGPLELLTENADHFQSFKLDYQEGAKYPRLTRVAGKPDRLSEIARPLAR